MKVLTFIIAMLMYSSATAQFADRIIIDTEISAVEMAIGADIDGDNDLDIVAINRGGYVSWYENLDGNGSFGPVNQIASFNQGKFVRAADLDGDNDIDIIALSSAIDTIVWYENLDGAGTFGASNVVTEDLFVAMQVIAADLDGDSDLDLISTSREDSKLAWYENVDGQGTYGPQILVTPSNSRSDGVAAGDIDGDNDIDIVATANGDMRVYWYENLDGNGNFGPPITVAQVDDFTGYHHVELADFDLDEDLDVLTVEYGGNTIAWHENLDAAGEFGPKQILSDNFDLPSMAYPADIDQDGDFDVLVCSANVPESTVGWYENTNGLGSFGVLNIISEGVELSPRSVYPADLNNDQFDDVLVSSIQQETISWYENLHTLGLDKQNVPDIALHPNPVNHLLQLTTPLEVEKAAIFDLSGRLVKEYVVVDKQVDVSGLSAGVYLLSFEVDGVRFTDRFVKR